jgi:hypothetical protein
MILTSSSDAQKVLSFYQFFESVSLSPETKEWWTGTVGSPSFTFILALHSATIKA